MSREPWEYLGLGDTNVTTGVRDVDAYGDRLIVAYDGRYHGVYHPDSVVSLWRSMDAGAHWSMIDSSIHTLLRRDSAFPMVLNATASIKRSPHKSNTLMAAISMATGILRTDDGGDSWKLICGNAHPTIGESAIWWNPGVPGMIYVQYVSQGSGRISIYNNDGDTLMAIIDKTFDEMAFIPEDTATVYSTSGYLNYSTDQGIRWERLVSDIWVFTTLAKHPLTNSLIACTYYHEVMDINPLTRMRQTVTITPWAISSNIVSCRLNGRIYFVCNNRIITIRLK